MLAVESGRACYSYRGAGRESMFGVLYPLKSDRGAGNEWAHMNNISTAALALEARFGHIVLSDMAAGSNLIMSPSVM